MAKSDEEEVKQDDLEITSIGSLYKGPWEKKYWSSSRGKDRYPYPVGYQAVRAHNGSTYKMEIHEGPKGPSFVIISTDGLSCCGTSPDIAWEKFQKKGFSRMKIWHGKRFSCKIDGVEFFGFKNPSVQRLLRELVANINGVAQQSLLSSSVGNEASSTKHNNPCSESCTNFDLLPYLANPLIRKKRSRCGITNSKSVSKDGLKRSWTHEPMHNARTSSSLEGNKRNIKHGIPMPGSGSGSEEKSSCYELPRASLAAVLLKPIVGKEKDHLSATDGFPLKHVCFSAHRNNCSKEAILFNRLHDTEVKGFGSPVEAKDKAGYVLIPKGSPSIHDVPDSLDFVQDDIKDSILSTSDKGADSVKEELNAAKTGMSMGLGTEMHLEVDPHDSNASSEKSDFDSLSQDMAKMMMTFLLPQAVPLLKKASRKKKRSSSLEKLPYSVASQEKNNKTSQAVDFPSPAVIPHEEEVVERKEEMQMRNEDSDSVPSIEHMKSVILDSHEDDQCQDQLTHPLILSSKIVEATQARLEDVFPPNTREQLISVDLPKECSQVDTGGSKDIFCYDEVHMAPNEKPQEGDVCRSKSDLFCISPRKKVLSEHTLDGCSTTERMSVGILKISPDCSKVVNLNDPNLRGMGNPGQITAKDFSFEKRASQPSSFNEVPKKVYTRKKVTKSIALTEKFKGPLSESIICRSFKEDCSNETYPATEILLATNIHTVSPFDCKLYRNDTFETEATLEGQFHCFRMETDSMNCKAVLNSSTSLASQNRKLICAAKGKVKLNCIDSSISHTERCQAHFDKELGDHEKLDDHNSSELFQKQESFCTDNTTNPKETHTRLDLEVNRDVELNIELEGAVELVGCYFHPMPVSSLWLSTKESEINICVLCGPQDDKNRTLFVYKLAIKEPGVGCPSFGGHSSVTLPFSEAKSGREIGLERSWLQFTPDGQFLVLLDSIKTPYCREGMVDCLCSTCASDSSEDNAVKIVQVNPGYVSVRAKLKTTESVQSTLVCEPDLLVSVGESGRLHLWLMNSAWSASKEEFDLPANDCITRTIEVKRIPRCATLLVGHNGFGEFSLWDISKRILVSKFSAPSSSVCQFVPVSLVSWQRKGCTFSHADVEECVDGILAATKIWFSDQRKDHSFLSLESENVAIWLLVYTKSNLDAEHNYESSSCQPNATGWWRLALLVKDMVILGRALDPRATVIGSSAGHGIIGTDEGLVYMWELCTGAKLGTLHHFKGSKVSSVATDDSRTGVIAMADDEGQLLVYRHRPENVADTR